jgi:hypothetical protein
MADAGVAGVAGGAVAGIGDGTAAVGMAVTVDRSIFPALNKQGKLLRCIEAAKIIECRLLD